MKPRFDHYRAAPDVIHAQVTLSRFSENSGLERPLLELVKIRASLLNGCAYCLEMHTREARAAGESEARLYLLGAWAESPLYTARERAALAWTDAVTLVATSRVPDDVYAQARAQFTEAELVKLTLAIGVINTWNRFAVAFRAVHPVAAAAAA